jgi:hypothetical protein
MSKKFLALMIGASLLAAQSAQAQTTDPRDLMRVVSYELVSQKRVGRTDFEYEYALTAENNTATDYSGVFVTLSSTQANAQLIDARADIGAFNRFSKKKAADTIKVKVNRSSPFDPKTLSFAFDNNTLEGIDADKDGIRDDIERFISNETRSETQQVVAKHKATLIQRILASDSLTDVEFRELDISSVLTTLCLDDLELDADFFGVELLDIYLNSELRIEAYDHYQARVANLGSHTLPEELSIFSFCESIVAQ